MDYEDATRRAIRTRRFNESVVGNGTVALVVMAAVGLERWNWVSTSFSYAEIVGGRILLDDFLDPSAGLVWTEVSGEPVIYQIWVEKDLRRCGVARALVDIYRDLVTPDVAIAGPFSLAGRRLAEAVHARLIEDEGLF